MMEGKELDEEQWSPCTTYLVLYRIGEQLLVRAFRWCLDLSDYKVGD